MECIQFFTDGYMSYAHGVAAFMRMAIDNAYGNGSLTQNNKQDLYSFCTPNNKVSGGFLLSLSYIDIFTNYFP